MHNRVRKIAALVLYVLTLSHFSVMGQSEVLWSQTYGGEQDETFQNIFITNDNGAQVIGYGQSNLGTIKSDNGLYDMIICAMNEDGALNWTSNIGGSQNDLGESILINEGKTYIGGLTYSTDNDVRFNLGAGDILFGSLDDEHQLGQSTLLGGNKLDNIVSMKMQIDGSIILVANTNSTDVASAGNGGATDIYICRLLPNGILMWENTIGSSGVDKASEMVINSNGEIIIVGTTFSDDFLEFRKGIKDGFVLCLNNEGEQVWGKRFSNGNYSSFSACDVDANNNILITGVQGNISNTNTGINGVYNEDIWVLKVNEQGSEVWRRPFGGSNNDFATDIVSSHDGGMLVVGHTESFDGLVNSNYGNGDAFALKLDTDGSRMWSKGYGGSQNDLIFGATQDRDGHYWLVGSTESADIDLSEINGGSDAWILKLEGEKPALQFDLGEAIRVCAGESFQIDATLNFCDCEYLWSDGFVGPNRTIGPDSDLTLGLRIIDEEGNEAFDNLEIIVNPLPQFDLIVTPLSCAGANDGEILANISAAALPVNYNWSSAFENEDIQNNLAAGFYSLTVSDRNGCASTRSTVIDSPEPIAVSATSESAFCDSNSGRLQVETTGGTAPYTYEWSNNQSGNTIENLGPGEYSLTISDANNCAIEQNYEITQEDIDFELQFEISNNNCFDGQDGNITILNSNEISSFVWNTGTNASNLSNLAVGDYELNYITAEGCTGFQSFEISEPSILEGVTNVIHNDCVNNNIGSIGLELRGGTPPYSYQWNNGVTNPFLTGLSGGSYQVTVSDANDCKIILEEEINSFQSLELADLEISNESCIGAEDGMINLTILGGSESLSYEWNNGNSTSEIQNLIPGVYTVTVSDPSGCSLIANAEILAAGEFPTLNLTQRNPTCHDLNDGFISIIPQDSNVDLFYFWPDGFIGNERNNLAAGEYDVTISSGINCVEIERFILEAPIALTMQLITSPISCFGEADASLQAMPIGGLPPYVISYSTENSAPMPISGNQVAEDLPAGQYIAQVTDANGCSLELPFEIVGPPAIIIQGIVTDVSCFGETDGAIETIISGGSGSLEYSWGGNNTESFLEGLRSGIYLVEVTDENNCFIERTFQVKQPLQLEAVNNSIPPTSNTSENGSIDLTITGGTEPYLIDWNNGLEGTNISSLGSGSYIYEITDANDCLLSGSITFETTNSASSLPAFEKLHIYPNPVDDLLQISFAGNPQGVNLTLYNTLGQTMHQSSLVYSTNGVYEIPVSHLSAGLYQLFIANETHQSSSKVVITHN